MAWQISSGLLQPGANSIGSHNNTHRKVAALEIAAGTKPHYDGPEVDTAGVEQVLTYFFPSTITDFSTAINCLEKAIVLWDTQHSNRHNSGAVAGIFSHKVAGTLIGGTVGASGASLAQAIVDALAPRCIELMTSLRAHMLNTGGTWHTAPDLFNVISVPASITTAAQLFDAVLLLRAVFEAHRVYGSGVEHSSSDTTNTIAAAPPDSADDFDGMLAVLVEVADELEDHVEDVSYHNAAMSVTYTVASFPAAVSTAFTRINLYKSTHNSDLGSTTIHESADSTYTIAASNATTIATYIALAEEIRTDQTGHFRNAPISTAQRGV